jgi:putative addiction module killer protein
MYYVRRGDVLIVMLGGGTKGTQARDIEKAIALAETIEDQSNDQEDQLVRAG